MRHRTVCFRSSSQYSPDIFDDAFSSVAHHTPIKRSGTGRLKPAPVSRLREAVSIVGTASRAFARVRDTHHWFPFLVWCIAGSRSPLWFLVDEGAWTMVASTIVPVAMRMRYA